MDKIVNTAISCRVTATSCGFSDEPTSIFTFGIKGAAEAAFTHIKANSRAIMQGHKSLCTLVTISTTPILCD